MKKNLLLYTVSACAMMFASCSQDLDYKGEYDVKGYYNGTDPRLNLLTFSSNKAEVVLPFIGETCVATEVTGKATVLSTRKVNDNEKFKLEVVPADDKRLSGYDASSLLGSDNAKFETSYLIEKDQISAEAPFTIGLNGVTPGQILPIQIVADDSFQLKASENRGLKLIQFSDQQAVVPVKQFFEKKIALTNNGVVFADGESVSLEVACTTLLKGDYTVNIVRDDEIIKDYPGRLRGYEIAPDNMFPSFEEKSLNNVESVNFSFSIAGREEFSEDKKIVLPLKIRVQNSKGEEVPLLKNRGDILIQLDIIKTNILPTSNQLNGEPLSKEGWEIKGTTETSNYNVGLLIDGNSWGYRYWTGYGGKSAVVIDMKQKHTLMGVDFTIAYQRMPDGVKFSVSDDGNSWNELSPYLENRNYNAFGFKFISGVKAQFVKIDFTSERSFLLKEVTLYGE